MGIEFEGAAPRAGTANDAQHVHVVGLAASQQAACGMGQQLEMRVVHGLQDALGLAGAGKLEAGMDRSDHHVEARKNRVGQIQAAVLQDVHLDAGEQPNAAQFLV